MNIDKAIEILQSGLITQQEQSELATVLKAKREWVGLTDDEVLTTWLSPDVCKVPQCDKYHYFYLAIEAKLRERNT
jgi:hypothetical protein